MTEKDADAAQNGPLALTDEQLAEVRAKAKKQVQDEQRKKLIADALEAALREERIAAGVAPTPALKPDEAITEVTLNLPDNVSPQACLVVDGRAYWHGATYKLPDSLARQLFSMQAECWKNQSRQEGKVVDIFREKPLAVKTVGSSVSVAGPMPVAI
jgi:hypothetical protein